MEKIWVLVWVIMTPQGDGVFTRDYGMAGPLEEHTCLTMRDEISELSSRRSERHALIASCRKLRPEDAKLLETLPRKPDERQKTTARGLVPDESGQGRLRDTHVREFG